MIEKEYGKSVGVCDCCGDTTPTFDSFVDCRNYMRKNRWKATKDETTGEWEDTCPECRKLNDF